MWEPPFPDASSVIISNMLDEKTIEPIDGFTDEELSQHHETQVDIMDNHEDYASLRGVNKINGDSEKEKEMKRRKRKVAVSKILAT